MKKLVQIFVTACMLVFSAQCAFAAEYMEVTEGADLTNIETIAIAKPHYTPTQKDPAATELLKAMVKGGDVPFFKIVPYEDIELKFLREKNVDLNAIDSRLAAEYFAKNTAGVADVYVIATVTTASKKFIFFELYKAGTDELLFQHQIEVNQKQLSFDLFEDAAHSFYVLLHDTQTQQMKKKEKDMYDKTKVDLNGKKPESGFKNKFKKN